MLSKNSFCIRTLSVGIVQGTSMTAFAASTKIFPHLIVWLNYYGANYYYAAITLAMTVWGSIKIEATDDMSLVEIERLYDYRSRKLQRSDIYGSTGVLQARGHVNHASCGE